MAHGNITQLTLPKTPSKIDELSIRNWINDTTRVMSNIISVLQRPDIRQYTLATLPDASVRNQGDVILVTDEIAGQQFKGSDGTAWRNLG